MIFLIEQKFIDALLDLHKTLEGSKIDWAIGGDLGEALFGVQVDPEYIELITNKDGAYALHDAIPSYCPSEIEYKITRLSREASLGNENFPVYMRSYFFDFTVKGVTVKVYGGLQYRISDWEWGDPLEFEPQFVYVTGYKTAILPLRLKYELHNGLGWTDKAEKISCRIMQR
jgi:hypothetical protein